MQDKLILRSTNSPYGDETKGSVLSHDEVDGNFIFLKGNILNSGYLNDSTLSLVKIDGSVIQISGFTSGTVTGFTDTFITGGTFNSDILSLVNNSGGTIQISGFTASGATGASGTTLYTGNGTILGNRNVSLLDRFLRFSSLNAPDLLLLSGNSIGVNTTARTETLNVSGSIGTDNGVRIGQSGQKIGIYNPGGNILDVWLGNNRIGTFSLIGTIPNLSYLRLDGGFLNNNAFYSGNGVQNCLLISSNVTSTTTGNSMNYTQLSISPTYIQGGFGTGALRGIYYNPTITSLNTSQHVAIENTTGDNRFNTTSGLSTFVQNRLTIGNQTSAYIDIVGNGGEGRKLLIGNSPSGIINITPYNNNTLTFDWKRTLDVEQPTDLVKITSILSYTAGSRTHNYLTIAPIFGVSGGTTNVRGIYYDPILSSLTGLTNTAWENTSGKIIFGNLASSSSNQLYIDSGGTLNIGDGYVTYDGAPFVSMNVNLSDAYKLVGIGDNGATPIVITIPLNATTNIPVNTEFRYVSIGSTPFRWTREVGVTLLCEFDISSVTITSSDRYTVSYLKKVATNTWVLWGRLASI